MAAPSGRRQRGGARRALGRAPRSAHEGAREDRCLAGGPVHGEGGSGARSPSAVGALPGDNGVGRWSVDADRVAGAEQNPFDGRRCSHPTRRQRLEL
eukprot:11676862-Alexandrium_andersonii.AAC.1